MECAIGLYLGFRKSVIGLDCFYEVFYWSGSGLLFSFPF